jgi:hypothetical protein
MTSPQRYQLMIEMMDAGFSEQYSANPSSHIETAVTSIGGPPPHQLGCGNGAATVLASTEDDNYDRIPHHSKMVKTKPSRVSRVLASKPKPISKFKIAKAKTFKQPSKKRNIALAKR